jgi:hypothetical protein
VEVGMVNGWDIVDGLYPESNVPTIVLAAEILVTTPLT